MSGSPTASDMGGASELASRFRVEGRVTHRGQPLQGALVLQAGGAVPLHRTGPDGSFSLELSRDISGVPTVVAAKEGFRTHGVECVSPPDGPVTLDLLEVEAPDDPGYVFETPGTGDASLDTSTAYCGHCHTTFVRQFQASAHARSARDPWVQDLYLGAAAAWSDEASCLDAGGAWRLGRGRGTEGQARFQCYIGGGVLPDLNALCASSAEPCDSLTQPSPPTAFGQCADCHAPGIDGQAGGRALHEAVGLAYEQGNHCDVCHHVRDVDLSRPPGTAGALVLQRPRETIGPDWGAPRRQAMFGPLPDVPNDKMGGVYAPVFSTAKLCAGCHQQFQRALLPGETLDAGRWPEGLPIHTTYREWEASSYAPEAPCQHCHMPADATGLANAVDVATPDNASITYGFVRPPERIRSHAFLGALQGAPRLVNAAALIELSVAPLDTDLEAVVRVTNTQAGHGLPTGEPMRALLLSVQAEACGLALPAIAGPSLDAIGGALAEQELAEGHLPAGSTFDWPEVLGRARPGQVLRLVRPSSSLRQDPGADVWTRLQLGPPQQGLAFSEPVSEAVILRTEGSRLLLDREFVGRANDRVYLGETADAAGDVPADRLPSLALAGSPGLSFARVLLGPSAEEQAPHYKAIDLVRDNRLAPLEPVTTTFRFARPSRAASCKVATVRARLLYRRAPLLPARVRGWEALDYVAAWTRQRVELP